MASRKKLSVEETRKDETEGLKIKFEEACVIVTTVALVIAIIAVFWMMGSHYDAGPFGG